MRTILLLFFCLSVFVHPLPVLAQSNEMVLWLNVPAECPAWLARGVFGGALDCREAQLTAAPQNAYYTPPLTVECWALLNSKTAFNVLVANEAKSSGTHWEIYGCLGSGLFCAYLPGYAGGDVRSSVNIADGQWHYLAMVFETNRVRLYVDAQIVANQAVAWTGAMAHQAGPLIFGALDAASYLKWDGLVDEVRISQGVRAITAVPDAPFVADAQTIGLWRMDDFGSSNEIADVSSRTNPAVALGSAVNVLTTLVPGKFGQALNVKPRQSIATAQSAYGNPPLTVETWARLDGSTTFNVLLANEAKSSGTHWELYTRPNNGVFCAYLPGYGADVASASGIVDGQWHYLAMTFEANRVRLYVDAQNVADQAISWTGTITHQAGPLEFGGVDGLTCDGLIDEVRISQGVRAITNVPTAPFVADAQTVGLWHMDQIIETNGTIADASVLNNPALTAVSLDDLDRAIFNAGPSPLASTAQSVTLTNGAVTQPAGAVILSLDGQWQMAEQGLDAQRLSGVWLDAIPATVPGSVHTALFAAGLIPDPKFGTNDAIAHVKSHETWWFKRTFTRPQGSQGEKLVFDGVAIHCTVWLNGQLLGTHDGMFGGPQFDVASLLQNTNTLIVKIDPAPGDPALWDNPAWSTVVVFNCVYGWHYSSIPALGLWRSVRIEGAPKVRLNNPFVATRDAQQGTVDMVADLEGPATGWSGTVSGVIEPDNFTGDVYSFAQSVSSTNGTQRLHLLVTILNPHLWWPNDMGEQNLYRLKLSFQPDGGGVTDFKQTTFGLRTIEMAPLPGGPSPGLGNWTFVVNKWPMFVKGNNWCTMDSSMDFSRERYDRFITLAKLAHVQMFRAWGSGMPETDDFYDLCDRNGIMVLQEWPTAWNTDQVQPYDQLEETVRLNTLRIRNHPSLAMYGGGNESSYHHSPALDMMGKYATELDGTRPFHLSEPYGGSSHNYNCYWGREPLDYNVTMTASFWGEFGLACMPVYESVLRYLPATETNLWPPSATGCLVHHTPKFNTGNDWSILSQYSDYFIQTNSLKNFILGSQLSQVVGLRHPLELARTRWPDCTGALFYKMNDNYPAASWSCVDWYGAPKIWYYFCQQTFAPLHACVIFQTMSNSGAGVLWPIFLLDDADALAGSQWEVTVRAYDAKLQLVKTESYPGSGSLAGTPRKLAKFGLDVQQAATTPLLIVTEVKKNGALADRTFYFVNYESVKGSLFTLPRTTLSLQVSAGQALVTNTGSVPAVGAAVQQPGHLDTFTADANYFWLDPGESKLVHVNATNELRIEAWNVD